MLIILLTDRFSNLLYDVASESVITSYIKLDNLPVV